MDTTMRETERAAATGDPLAVARLARLRVRTTAQAPLTVRRFSAYGPCLVEGDLVRETPRFYVVRDPGGERRVGKGNGKLVHVEPCRSCRDHAETQYPDGYQD